MTRLSGRLGAVDVTAGENTTLYAVPTGIRGSLEVVVNVCNRNESPIKYRLALMDGVVGTLSEEDYIEYDIEVAANGLVRSGGITMSVGDVLAVYANKSNVSFQAWGV